MLLGTYQGVISLKRRVAIPAPFRKALGPKFIIAKWYESCLILTTLTNFEALLRRLRPETNLITQGIRDTDRFILGSAYEVEVDEQGRVVIPRPLATYAGIVKEVSFIGLGDRVEVWDRENWLKKEEMVTKTAASTLEKLAHDK
jgi:MraZ protein